MVINLNSKNGNSLVWTEKNSGAEQLHSYATRTLKRKKTHKAKITALKNAFHWDAHIEISIVKPAATAQIPLKFRGQKVGYHLLKYKGGLHTSKEKRAVATNWSHKGELKWVASSQAWRLRPDSANVRDNLGDHFSIFPLSDMQGWGLLFHFFFCFLVRV